MQTILLALWPLFALIVMGFILQRLHVFPAEFWRGAERLNYFLFLPALFVSSLANAPLENPHLLRIAVLIVIGLASGWLVLHQCRQCSQWSSARFGILVQGALRFNTYLGLAAVTALYGTSGMAIAALIIAVKVPILNVLSVWAFAAGKRIDLLRIVVTILKNPLIIACLTGVSLNMTGIGLPLGSDHLLHMLGAGSLPLGLLCVGAALQPAGLLRERHALMLNSLAKLLVLPAFVAGCAWLLGLPVLEANLVILFFALPTAPSAYILTQQMGGDGRLMAGVITLQTLLSAMSLPIIFWLLGNL